MSNLNLVFALPLTGLLFLAGLILRQEYMWWAPRVTERIVSLAARLTPAGERAVRRAEWLGEADELRHQCVGGGCCSPWGSWGPVFASG